ncbi:MAG: hypothetical protein ACM33T_16120 [Solirubrobacterales bacterium]
MASGPALGAISSVAAASALLALHGPAAAHGFVGERFFPATLATDDPFVADELSAPTVSSRKMPAAGDEPATPETEYSFEFSKRITPRLGLSLEDAYQVKNPSDGPKVSGWSNAELGLTYQFFTDEASEAVASASLGWEIERTGTDRVGADPFSTLTPSIQAGKGFGNLPDTLAWLRPLAVTGIVRVAIPLRAKTRTATFDPGSGSLDVEIERHPDVLQWGGSVQYSLPYLQANVRDLGLPEAVGRVIPLVEFVMETPLNRGEAGHTTGTINPGFVWVGQKVQFGVEMEIPVNDRSGHWLGFVAQLHFYLDDLFPTTLGRPLVEWR